MKKTSIVLFIAVFAGLIPVKAAHAGIFSDFVSSLKDLQVHLTELVNVTKNASSGDAVSCEAKNCPAVKLNEINIPELGVKLSVPNNIKDLKYLVATTSATSTSKTVLLSTETLDSLDDNCTMVKAPLGMLSLSRYSTTTVASASATTTTNTKTGAIQAYTAGAKQIIYQAPQIYCSDNKLVQGLLSKQMRSLQDSLKTLSPLSTASSTLSATSTLSVASSTESTADLTASVILFQTATSTATTTAGQ